MGNFYVKIFVKTLYVLERQHLYFLPNFKEAAINVYFVIKEPYLFEKVLI